MTEVRCSSCGTLNRVAHHSIMKVPNCGKCSVALPQPNYVCAAQWIYRQRRWWLPLIIGGVIVYLYSQSPSRTTVSSQKVAAPVPAACVTRGLPPQGLYEAYSLLPAIASLTIRTAVGSNYFVKLVDAVTESPVRSFFVYGGSTIEADVPLGSFILKYATGRYWCGEFDLFGPDTTTSQAEDTLTFERIVTDRGYTSRNWEVELILQRGGNLRIKRINRGAF
jgi:hypothetical protein